MSGETSLRGCIIGKWEDDDSPLSVQYDQVLQWATDCDSDFESRGLNPAPVFRGHLKNRNDTAVSWYLHGNRFPFRIV